MVKKNNSQEEKPKPKYQQTKLCFTVNKDKKNDQDLEKSIQSLNINNHVNKRKHPDPCILCDKSIPRIQCTAIKDSQPCTISYCQNCIQTKLNDNVESIKKNKDEFYDTQGNVIKHRLVLTNLKWACIVCRGLCDCEYCANTEKQKGSKLSFNIKKPDLTPFDLLYSEHEIWIRLEIREFMFRFSDLYKFDQRYLSSLQNVQGDWRIKRLGAYIVWQVLKILGTTAQYETPQHNTQEESVPQRAKKITHNWMLDSKIIASYLDTESRQRALLELLCLEGMTGKRWQDIAELLALAEFENIPVPTSRDFCKQKLDEDDMDIDISEELERKIARFKKSSRSSALLSALDELNMMNMLLQLLLFESDIRHSLNSQVKETKDLELEYKKYHREYMQDELRNKNRKSHLSTRMTQLKMIRGKDKELKQVEIELDLLETHIRDERMNLEKKKLELDIQIAKSQKRLEPAGHDPLGNEYWIFNDILDHLNHATDYRNSEPFWAYGIVVIGPGYTLQDEKKWWYIKGKNNITALIDWIKSQSSDQGDSKTCIELTNKLKQRLNYLNSLEWTVYGVGFFN